MRLDPSADSASQRTGSSPARIRGAPRLALLLIVALYLSLSLAIALLTPPWEANDEADHVRNVETLVRGRAYRIPKQRIGTTREAVGLEPHQPPLYYMILAGWQGLLGDAARTPAPTGRTVVGGVVAPRRGEPLYAHDTPTESADRRLVRRLRLPGVAFGVVVILLTAATARRLTDDVWTPVVASAIVASVPKFSFLSAVVNNDNLVNVLAACGTFLGVVAASTPGTAATSRRVLLSVALGLLAGALVLAKVSALMFALPLALAAFFAGRNGRERTLLVASVVGGAIVVSGWWLVRNQIWYGDPLASEATHSYLGALVSPANGALEQAFVKLPQGVWKSAWYNSGWNQFDWPWWAYFPFSLLAALGFAGFIRATRWTPPSPRRNSQWLLLVFAASAAAIIWVVGLSTPQTQARIGFGGLAAIGCTIAIGFEQLGLPLAGRLLLPLLGLAGTTFAFFEDVLGVYH